MTTSPVTIRLQPGYRGFVAGTVNAQFEQRAFVDVRDNSANQLASATFGGKGSRVHMQNIFDNRENWSFGPFSYEATIHVKITYDRGGGGFGDSKMVGPLSIVKQSEPNYPVTFYSATIASENSIDESHDDCTIVVLQYKE